MKINAIGEKVPRAMAIAFVESYPRNLERDVCGIYEPPLETWNDFSTGEVWPGSVVVAHTLGDDLYTIYDDVRDK